MTQPMITATLDGVSMGEFEKRSGGDVSAEVTKRRPGGMKAEKFYPGQATAADVVVERVYEAERDFDWVKLAEARCGRGVLAVTEQLNDDNGVPIAGKLKTWKGILNHVEPSEADANQTDPRTFALTAPVGLPA